MYFIYELVTTSRGIRRAVQCGNSEGSRRVATSTRGNDEQLPDYCVLIWFNFTDFKTHTDHLCACTTRDHVMSGDCFCQSNVNEHALGCVSHYLFMLNVDRKHISDTHGPLSTSVRSKGWSSIIFLVPSFVLSNVIA